MEIFESQYGGTTPESMGGSRKGGTGGSDTLENHKIYGFLYGINNWTPPPWKKLESPSGKMLDPLWNLGK